MSLPVSRERKVWRLIQVLLGGVFFYAWMWIRWAELGGYYGLIGPSILVAFGSIILVGAIEVYLWGIS